MKILKILTILGLGLLFCIILSVKAKNLNNINQISFDNDLNSILLCREGLDNIIYDFQKKKKNLNLINRDSKIFLLQSFEKLLDYYFILDNIKNNRKNFYHLKNKSLKEQSFYIYQMAAYTEYRYALDYLKLLDNIDNIDTILNEKHIDFDFPEDMFKLFKLKFLNFSKASEFLAIKTVSTIFPQPEKLKLKNILNDDMKVIFDYGFGKGEFMTLKNGLKIIQNTGEKILFPVQKGVSTWMGKTKIKRQGEYLIPIDLIKKVKEKLKPGDILIERREWYMTNMGIPGFWTHAALYIGTPKERAEYFKDINKNFESILKTKYPKIYVKSKISSKDSNPARVIEAISDGVSFTSIEYSAHCDSLAVLRTNLSKQDIAKVILRAFKYSGRPYDYKFDFFSDNSLVCTELVYKCYEPEKNFKGLNIPLKEIMGHMILPANDLAKIFDEEYGETNSQFQLITFIDGYEKEKTAVEKNDNIFRKTWKRPKWHIIIQNSMSK